MNKIAQRTRRSCPYCEGRGCLYDGAPDAEDTPTEECDACHGTGYDVERERMMLETDSITRARA